MEKIQKIIANAGYASRRKAEELISEGRVLVNGKIATIGMRLDNKDKIEVDGTPLNKDPLVYYLLYKPEGYISSTKDEAGRKTVLDLINSNIRVYPVGRLDYDTSGLLLITNDGALANALLHPKYQIPKKYMAKIDGLIDMKRINVLKKGIMIENTKVIPDKIKVRSKNLKNKTSIVELVIHDGKNHEVKKLFAAIGFNVIKLKRTEFAFLNLNLLKKGEYRKLSGNEVKQLKSLIK